MICDYMANKKLKCGDYSGVMIRNKGTIRWFSDMKVYDEPIFTWSPLDNYNPSNKKAQTSDKVKTSSSPTWSSKTTSQSSSPALSFKLDASDDEWPVLTA